jgi:hypothetical protein
MSSSLETPPAPQESDPTPIPPSPISHLLIRHPSR